MIRPTPEHFGTYDESEYPHLWSGRVGAWCPSVQPPGGTRLWDYSSQNNFGTIDGAISLLSAGQYELLFDGSNDLVTIPSSRFEDFTSGAVSLWLRLANLTHYGCVFSLSTVGSLGSEYRLDFRGTTTDQFQVVVFNNPVAPFSGFTGFVATTLDWLHIVFQSNGALVTCFVNGSQTTLSGGDGTNTGQWFAASTNVTGASLGIIRRSTNVLPLAGAIDDVAIYDRALSPSEIRELFLLGRAGAYTPRSRHFYPQSFAQTSRLLQLRRSAALC